MMSDGSDRKWEETEREETRVEESTGGKKKR